LRLALLRDEDLTEAVRAWLRNGTVPSPEHFTRLCAAGVMTGIANDEMRTRCQLYGQFLRKILL
jgi:hypothetical protein